MSEYFHTRSPQGPAGLPVAHIQKVISMNDLHTPGIIQDESHYANGDIRASQGFTEMAVTSQKSGVPEALQIRLSCWNALTWVCLVICQLYFYYIMLVAHSNKA